MALTPLHCLTRREHVYVSLSSEPLRHPSTICRPYDIWFHCLITLIFRHLINLPELSRPQNTERLPLTRVACGENIKGTEAVRLC